MCERTGRSQRYSIHRATRFGAAAHVNPRRAAAARTARATGRAAPVTTGLPAVVRGRDGRRGR